MRPRTFAVAAVLLALSLAAFAVTPQFWENFTQEELLKGDFRQLSLAPDGRMFLAPAYDLVFDTGQAYIFSMVRDKGGNLYVGTGDEGKVYRIDPQGKGSLYFQSKELNVFALALDSSGTLYAATSPDGKVYKISGATQSTEFCDPESKYIWAMAFDAEDNLYVGTGANGVVYKVDKGGEKSVYYTCSDNHVVSFFRDGKDLLAGTSPGGLIVRISPDGKGFVLMDTPLEEVHALEADRFGTIYAVASSAKGAGAIPSAKPASAAAAAAQAIASAVIAVDATSGSVEKPKDAKTVTAPGGGKESAPATSAIYAITKDGSTETVYSSATQMVFGTMLRDDGSIWIATGPRGRLLSVDTAKQVSVISDFPEEDLTRLLPAGDAAYLGTSNRGKVYRLNPRRAQSGVFESAALDAKTVASWGRISWQAANAAGASVELSTRTGNTGKADGSWSDWSAPYTAPGQQIASPRARYLQWRAAFKAGSGGRHEAAPDALDRVQIAYLQQNLRPQVTSIELLPYGVELQKQPSLASGGMGLVSPAVAPGGRSLNAPRERGKETQPLPPRQALQPGAQSFTWKAVDENEDSLEYALYFRGEAESEWKLLDRKLKDNFYTLNAASLPDGVYRVKVVASDAPSNPHDRFLVGELVSIPFLIANATPRIEIAGNKTAEKRVEVQFLARVATGRIATAEFSIDGGEWLLIFPVDGIADSAQEEYRFQTPELAAGEHLVGIRASDGDGNTGTGSLLVRIR